MKTAEDVLVLARPALRALTPYSSARDEFDQTTYSNEKLIFLDANESPYSSPYNRYPDPHQRQLKKQISAIKSVPEESIFLGNGSDEAIDLLIRTFCAPTQHNIIIPAPTYGMYAVSAAINEVAVKYVSLTATYDLDDSAVMKAVDRQTRIIFLCSPNNPTGNILSRASVDRIIEAFDGIVVVDEAYIDFTETPSLIKSLERKVNLVVLQTLSKAWGLAGLRLGMAFAHQEIISLLNKIKPPYNVSSVSQEIAQRILSDQDSQQRRVIEIRTERSRLAKELTGLACVSQVFPSQSNFLLVKVKDASRAYGYLVGAGIVVRDRSKVRLCEGCLRITVGTPDENNKLLTALASYE
jgi:histidinol-phosphate aminotransferase